MKAFETPPKVVPESPKNLDPSANISKDVSKTSPAKDFKENGIRVSVNGKEGRDLEDGGVVGTQEILVERVFECEDTVDLRDNEVGGVLEDSEMNGVSSLLKMQESKSLRGLGSVLDVIDKREKRDFQSGDGVSLVADICGDFDSGGVREIRRFDREEYPDETTGEVSDSKDREEGEEENMGDDGEHEFGVGDFVWGKIKSHPWWPGRVYDPLDASEYAKKVKQKDKILVAYFGDGTFAWCNPSQLKPLDENFVEMSKQSSSKNFFNAVEKAMDEVGRLVDLKMTCSCVPKENLIGFGRTLAVNAGTKEGLLVPEGGIDKFSNALFEPAEFLAALKYIAQVATVTNLLEFTVLKSSLSAFYRAKGGYQLPSYHEPKPIIGLEDDTRNWTVDKSNYNNGVEVRIQGPIEEDWLSSPTGIKYGQTTQSMLHKCQGVSESGHYQRRKQKSLAEIMDGNADSEAENKDDDLAEEGAKSIKEASSLSKRKRKHMGEDMNAEGKSEVMDMTREGSSIGKPAALSGRKKRKVSDEADGGKPSSGLKKRKNSDESDVNNNSGSSDLLSKLRTRKDTKFSESLAAAGNKVSIPESDDSKVKKESMKSPLQRGRKKASSNVEDGGGGKNEEMKEKTVSAKKKVSSSPDVSGSNAKAKEQMKKGSLPRERKRSKYLSPPYTDLNKMLRKQEIEAESLKVTSEARLGGGLTKAAGHFTGSSPTLMSSSEKFQKKPSKEPGAERETSDNSGPQTPRQDQINIDPMIVKVPANEVLSKIKSAALNPQYVKEANSLDVVGEFFSAFRSSICCDGSNYEMNSEHRQGRRRKFQKSEPGPLEEQNETDHSSPDHKSQRTKSKKGEEIKSDKPKVKQAASVPDTKTKDKESNGEAPGAALYVTFGPGSSLPSKNDLIKIYGKFGALNEDETEMYYTNYCARIVFLKSSEAEEAFNDSQLSSPFKAANVTFRLRYLSAETKTRELRDISSSKPFSLGKEGKKTAEMPSVSQSLNSDTSQLNFIKQKLEMITSMVQMSDDKISPDMKSTLEGEMKVLLEKVSTMISSSS